MITTKRKKFIMEEFLHDIRQNCLLRIERGEELETPIETIIQAANDLQANLDEVARDNFRSRS